VLQLAETDMTLFFRNLAQFDVATISLESTSNEDLMKPLMEAYYLPEELGADEKVRITNWIRQYISRLADDGDTHENKCNRMNAVNPKYVLRNYLAQLAIDKSEQGDHSLVNELLEVLRNPYEEQPGKESFAEKRPEWARNRPGCSTLSCSS